MRLSPGGCLSMGHSGMERWTVYSMSCRHWLRVASMSTKSLAFLGFCAFRLNKSLSSKRNKTEHLWGREAERQRHSLCTWELVTRSAVLVRGRPREYGWGINSICHTIYSFISSPSSTPTNMTEVEQKGIKLKGQIEQERGQQKIITSTNC